MVFWPISEAVFVTPVAIRAPLQLFALSSQCLGVYKFHGILPQNIKWINRENIDTSHSLSSSIWNCFLSTQLCSLTGSSLLLILYCIPTSIVPSAWVSWACTLFLTHTTNGMLNSARTDLLGLTVKFSGHLQMVVKVVVAWNWPQWDINAHDHSSLHLGLRISGGSCPLTSFLSCFLPKPSFWELDHRPPFPPFWEKCFLCTLVLLEITTPSLWTITFSPLYVTHAYNWDRFLVPCFSSESWLLPFLS